MALTEILFDRTDVALHGCIKKCYCEIRVDEKGTGRWGWGHFIDEKSNTKRQTALQRYQKQHTHAHSGHIILEILTILGLIFIIY